MVLSGILDHSLYASRRTTVTGSRTLKSILIYALCSLALTGKTILHCELTYGDLKFHHDGFRYPSADGVLAFERIAFLLSEFQLQGVSGQRYPVDDSIFYFEASPSRPHSTLNTLDSYPEPITHLHFSLGLPQRLNLGNVRQYPAKHPLNPVYNNLHWSPETGYIFMALEGSIQQPESPTQGFSLHYANQHNVLPLSVALQTPTVSPDRIDLSLDLKTVLSGILFHQDGYTTHSKPNDPLAQKLRANLATSFSLNSAPQSLRTQEHRPPSAPLYLPQQQHQKGFPLKIGRRFPLPSLPPDNPLLTTRVLLGKKLFHDPLLSQDRSLSCASCHHEQFAFADDSPLSSGFQNQLGQRNSMPLFNLAWKPSFFWDGRSPTLRDQVLDPISDPHELATPLPTLVQTLSDSSDYPALFAQAFDSPEVTAERIALALEAFLLTLTSYDSKFDQALSGQAQLTDLEQRGLELFMTEYEPRLGSYGADCFHCHGGPLFTDHAFHNNGLADLQDLGRFHATQRDSDKGKFLTPSLRNIELTAPYMHDGRFNSLEEVVAHYASPLPRTPGLAPLAPNLAKHGPNGIPLSQADQKALVAFLKTLTDPKFRPVSSPLEKRSH